MSRDLVSVGVWQSFENAQGKSNVKETAMMYFVFMLLPMSVTNSEPSLTKASDSENWQV